MPAFISIGCECGGPEGRIVAQRKVVLYQALSQSVSSTHCTAIDEYALVLRVDGRLAQYGPEGLARLRFAKQRRYITVDIQIPEAVWVPLVPDALDAYLVKQVALGLNACSARLIRDGYDVQQEALMAEVALGFAEFLASKASAARPQ